MYQDQQLLPEQIDYLLYYFLKERNREVFLGLKKLLRKRNDILRELNPQTIDYLNNDKKYSDLFKKRNDYDSFRFYSGRAL